MAKQSAKLKQKQWESKDTEINETTFLLVGEDIARPKNPHRRNKHPRISPTVTRRSFPLLCLAVFILTIVLVQRLPSRFRLPQLRISNSLLLLLLGDHESQTNNKGKQYDDIMMGSPQQHTVKFADLASMLLTEWFQTTADTVESAFTEQMMPIDTAQPRKVILMTRDLLDIFSPVYHQGLWIQLRSLLDRGYETVGHFLDLNHAHIEYEQETLVSLREEVLDWKQNFTTMMANKTLIFEYLQKPSHHKSIPHKESHFFWRGVYRLPEGSVPASEALATLGKAQAELSLKLLSQTLKIKSVLKGRSYQEALKRQEIFHGLRKALRALCDEYNLLTTHMFPPSPRMEKVMAHLSQARTVLGTVNDQWTAWDFYRAQNITAQHSELESEIDASFQDLIKWASRTDLKGSLKFLKDTLSNKKPKSDPSDRSTLNNFMSLPAFLQKQAHHPTTDIVIGNEAGDADSIISAVSLAYVESPITLKTPVISIPKADLSQRPETMLLLHLAGVPDPTSVLTFIDSQFITGNSIGLKATLVDHNELEEEYAGWNVTEIVDHHTDAGLYLDAKPRWIAFSDGKALAASTCTLVTERMKELWDPPFPASVSLLLLGVILLDSVGLSPEAGKVTDRDRSMVTLLLDHTAWDQLPLLSREAIGMPPGVSRPDTVKLFNLLQDSKYDSDFWNSITVNEALRYDYKDFDTASGEFGIASLLTSFNGFLTKPNLIVEVYEFMEKAEVNVLAVMLASRTDTGLHRQLALFVKGRDPTVNVDQLVAFLLQSTLQLSEIPMNDLEFEAQRTNLQAYFFEQGNSAASRKQIAPLLQDYFGSPPQEDSS